MKLHRRNVKPFGWLQTHRAGAGCVAVVVTQSRELAAELFAVAFGPRHDCLTYELPAPWAGPSKRWGDSSEENRVYIAGGLFVHWTENPFFPWAKFRTLQKHQSGVWVYPRGVVQ